MNSPWMQIPRNPPGTFSLEKTEDTAGDEQGKAEQQKEDTAGETLSWPCARKQA